MIHNGHCHVQEGISGCYISIGIIRPDLNQKDQMAEPGGEEPSRHELWQPLEGEVGKERHIGQVVLVP